MHPTAVINVVGLSLDLLGENTPHLNALAGKGSLHRLEPVMPAVTCTVQSTFLTGASPAEHGIVGNGWYFRDLAQVLFWQQSNRLVGGENVWEAARRVKPGFTCAKLFWWFNMYSSADLSVTPRPIYPADGRKVPEIYTSPASLGERLKAELGEFPFFQFWGPDAGLRSTLWIAEAARRVFDWHAPDLNLVYLPHLDYNLQRLGPDDPAIREDVRALDRACGELVDYFLGKGVRVLVLSEYGITRVDGAVHLNRVLREAGLLRVRSELGLEALDAGASDAFAVADHQVAHVYVRDPQRIREVRDLLLAVPGVDEVLDAEGKRDAGLDHPRSGELVAISAPDKWFTYYYWMDDRRAPDFARTVDIHRKPGYDPVELFLDPKIRFPRLKLGSILLRRKLGLRCLVDLISLDASLVKGSHGRRPADSGKSPVLLSSERLADRDDPIHAADVKSLILQQLFE